MKAFLVAFVFAAAANLSILTASPDALPQVREPLVSTGDGPQFVIDAANFQGLGNDTYIEFYVQVPFDELQFIKHKRSFRAEYEIDIELFDAAGKKVQSYSNVDVIQVNSFPETVSKTSARIAMLAYTFVPGSYEIKAKLRDSETRGESHIAKSFIAQNFKPADLKISDIQLSQKIEAGTGRDSYVKNGRYIEPNPARIFLNTLSDKVYVYFEVYHFKTLSDFTDYRVEYVFRNSAGEIKTDLQKSFEKPGTSAAQSIAFSLDRFSTGNYFLTVRVEDTASGETSENTTSFSVLEVQPALTTAF